MGRTPILYALTAAAALGLVLLLAVALGGPGEPAPMPSITQAFKTVDYSALPAVERFADRHGASLAFRRYVPATDTGLGSVVLIHGSSATGSSMHPLAQAFRDAGFDVYALDMRGHGASGTRGKIDHVGQLEDDVEDFVRAVAPAAPRTLAGFSSGGGFVLRFASDARQTLFDRYLLLAPFLSQDAPTQRPNSGGWISVGLPRYIALAVLNRVGITTFNDLPVTRFSIDDGGVKAGLTPAYSFALAQNFRPRADYMADIAAVRQPLAVVVGQQDEAFHAVRFAEVFAARTPAVPVTVLPNVGHTGLTLDPAALRAVVAALPPLQPRELNP